MVKRCTIDKVEWSMTLKPGDEVALRESHGIWDDTFKIVKVEKVTKTGQVKIEGIEEKFVNGAKRSASKLRYNYGGDGIEPIVDEIIEEIKREKLLRYLKDKHAEHLKTDQLEKLVNFFKENELA
jgi:hypothetical protein